MNQVSFGNGVPTRTQVAVHSVGAQSTDGESSEAVAASDTMTQSAAEMGYAQDAGQNVCYGKEDIDRETGGKCGNFRRGMECDGRL